MNWARRLHIDTPEACECRRVDTRFGHNFIRGRSGWNRWVGGCLLLLCSIVWRWILWDIIGIVYFLIWKGLFCLMKERLLIWSGYRQTLARCLFSIRPADWKLKLNKFRINLEMFTLEKKQHINFLNLQLQKRFSGFNCTIEKLLLDPQLEVIVL